MNTATPDPRAIWESLTPSMRAVLTKAYSRPFVGRPGNGGTRQALARRGLLCASYGVDRLCVYGPTDLGRAVALAGQPCTCSDAQVAGRVAETACRSARCLRWLGRVVVDGVKITYAYGLPTGPGGRLLVDVALPLSQDLRPLIRAQAREIVATGRLGGYALCGNTISGMHPSVAAQKILAAPAAADEPLSQVGR